MKISFGEARRRLPALLVAALTAIGMCAAPASADGFADTAGHWGATAIDRWAGYGVLHGDGDGTFAPDRGMTVAELATVLSNTFGYTETGGETVSPAVPAWAVPAVQKAVRAGAITSGETGLTLTRELAAKIVAGAFGIAPVSGASKFADDGSVSAAYRPYVKALGDAGVFNGDASLNFMPKKGLTRAEIMQVLDNTVTGIVREDGAASSEKSLVVNTPGVSLTGGTVKGDLIIGQGVGEGDVTLTDVTVEGRLVVYGGGAESLHIRGASSIPSVMTNKTFGSPVRIAVEGTANVGTVSVAAGSDVAVDGNVSKLEVVPTAAVTESGEVGTTAAESASTGVQIVSGRIGEVSVSTVGVTMSVAAGVTVVQVTVTAGNVAVTVAAGATVTNVTVAASNVEVGGAGTVTNVRVDSGEGVAVTVANANVTVSVNAGTVSTGDGKTINSGTTAKSEVSTGSQSDTPTAPKPPSGNSNSGNNNSNTEPDRSDAKIDRGNYKIAVSHMAGLTFVIIEAKQDSGLSGFKVSADGKDAKVDYLASGKTAGQYRAVLTGNYGLTEIAVVPVAAVQGGVQ